VVRQLREDLKLAARRLVAARLFTAFSVVTVAVAIASTASVYSVLDATIFRTPGFRDSHRVMNLYHSKAPDTPLMAFAWHDYLDLSARQTSFAYLAGWSRFRHTLVGGGTAQVILGEAITGEYFDLLGAEMLLGRPIQKGDDAPVSPNVVVLSHAVWSTQFHGDPNVVGTVVHMAGRVFEVIGVTTPAFRGADLPTLKSTAVWIPMSQVGQLRRAHTPVADSGDRNTRWVMVKGRLRNDVDQKTALKEIETIGAQLDETHPIGKDRDRKRGFTPVFSRQWTLVPSDEVFGHESVSPFAMPVAWTVMGCVVVVLLVACANIAHLVLARGAQRTREFWIRRSLGATRVRLVLGELMEGLLLALAGGICAIPLIAAFTRFLGDLAIRLGPGFVLNVRPAVSAPVCWVVAGAVLLAVVSLGLIPAIRATEPTNAGSSTGRHRSRARPTSRLASHNLLASQVAVSAFLLMIAALCVAVLTRTAQHDPGFRLDRLGTVRVDFSLQNYSQPETDLVLTRLLDGARHAAEISSVAVGTGLPVGPWTLGSVMQSEDFGNGTNSSRFVDLIIASPSYFTTVGIPVRIGRTFTDADLRDSLAVSVLSHRAATMLFGANGPAVGRSLRVQQRAKVGELTPVWNTVTVVGIAADTDVGTIGDRSRGVVYLPLSQHPSSALSIVAGANGSPASAARALERILHEVDPDLALIESGAALELSGSANLPARVAAAFGTTLGLLTVVLAVAGIYGALGQLVTARTREFGIRIALGATARSTQWTIIRRGLRPVVEGLILGLGAAIGLTAAVPPRFWRFLPSFSPGPPLTVAVLLLAVSLLACYLPSRRALALSPADALREE